MTKIDPYMRPPSQVMRLSRMGSAHPMRLSFLRILLRRFQTEGWTFDRPVWAVDDRGVGHAVYRATGPDRVYSLVAFAHDLPDDQRSDRVIATAWDATFALVDGDVDADDIERLSQNVPLQEAGRISHREITLSRANRSVRLFSHVIDALKQGQQPDRAELDAVGYLMRTTAVYGSGKFGAQDYDLLCNRDELSSPFQAEMLTVWFIRWFTVDIVNHLARVAGGSRATTLDPRLAQSLGVGNSTGLGMAPFLVRHPQLINNWIAARETALARVRARPSMTAAALDCLRSALKQAIQNAALWRSEHTLQVEKLSHLRHDLSLLETYIDAFDPATDHPWDAIWRWAEQTLSEEGQEATLSLILEPHGDIIDDLASTMSLADDALETIDGAMSVGDLRSLIQTHFDWAAAIDFTSPDQNALFWYVSEEKLEPRLGSRATEDGADREQPLGIAHLVHALSQDLTLAHDASSVAEFLQNHPQHRLIIRRVQNAHMRPYGEVRDNLIGQNTLPIDLMRCKLAFFGASRFDPRSDKWVRISLFQDFPYPYELGTAQN